MNRLQNEASPYLRQHAENPVDWYPWGHEAFTLAQSENKPVLLSIGYSSCHWCHVMAHESFEDEATAQVMNENFVNIKVDREERPDVDAIYMEAVQAMSGSGGWPMTVFMTPDAKPFFAGTYFPKEPTQGHPGFVSVLTAVSQAWTTQQDEVVEQAQQLREAIADRVSLDAPGGAVDITVNEEQWTKNAIATATNEADMTWGGFGKAPKFPHVETLDLLLANNTTEAVTVSLDTMAAGGIYDQIGGGFSRYSVDAFWMVPHFEKMLYDNAGLVRVYLHAYQVTGEERFKRIAEETIGYVLRDLGSPQGAFFSAEDADSEGEEGKFYTWRTEKVRAIIGNDETTDAFIAWYGMTNAGNFEGANILHRPNRDAWDATPEINAARQALLAERAKRVRPGLDDKVLTEWNAMFIASLAEAGAALGRPEWVARAEAAAQFLVDNLRNDNRWLRSWHSSTGPKQLAFASDYAWLINCFVSLREATGKTKYLTQAVEVADQMIELFWDEQHGGVFTAGSDAEELIVRAKDLIDSAYASTNGTAAYGLARVALLTGESKYRSKAEAIVALIAEPLSAHPTAFISYLSAIRLLGSEGTETVIAGNHQELVDAVHKRFAPTTVLTWGEPDQTALWEGKTDGAYVCQNMACQAPTTDVDQLMKLTSK